MSGFALLVDLVEPLAAFAPQFDKFVKTTANHKNFTLSPVLAAGKQCAAAKFDSPATLHQGLVQDPDTDSWLLAVGTVLNAPNGLHSLLADYLQHGTDILGRLDGHFALVIYNGRLDTVTVVTDPSGFISVFYAKQGNRVYVATSAIAVANAVRAKPSELGSRYFLAYGQLLGELTLWQEVKRLAPASALCLAPAGLSCHNYWSFQFKADIARLSQNQAGDYIIEQLSAPMQSDMRQHGTTWLSLTGGLDSRMLALLAAYSRLSFKTYCHGQPDSKDVRLAALISQTMGWEHEYFSLPDDWGKQRVDWLTRTIGQTDGHLGVLKTSRIIREQTLKARQYPASLWGFGGETYRGYYWKQEFFGLNTHTPLNYDHFIDYRVIPHPNFLLRDAERWAGLLRETLKNQLHAIGEQQPALPKPVKLDLLGNYFEHGWGGAHVSAALGIQRAVAPFAFKAGTAAVLSVNHQWRTHSKLFRLMLEKVNPVLANFETADGGPAVPMRLSNLHRFGPYWTGLIEKLAWRITRKVFGKTLWRKRDAGPAGLAYPEAQWRKDTLAGLDDMSLLNVTRMYSADLYQTEMLKNFLAQARTDHFQHETLLSHILTVEMALRAAGTTF